MDNQKPTNLGQPQQSGRAFRGRFMDMVHPSSDVKNTHKQNLATQHPVTKPHIESTTSAHTFESPFQPKPASDLNHILKSAETSSNPVSKPETINRDFADEIRNAFEPTAYPHDSDNEANLNDDAIEPKSNIAEKIDADNNTDSATDDFKSPFLEGVKVDKRPLGEAAPSFDWTSGFEDPELPSGDEDNQPELALTDGIDHSRKMILDQNESTDVATGTPLKETFNSVSAASFDLRAALDNSVSIDKSHDNSITESKTITKNSTKHAPSWWWLLATALLIVAGASIGVLLYMFPLTN